ncbi:MAG: hypothetical protein FJW14_11640 [Acidimicrobiia bacterium]|nr:hypothetical protein [Acidimicrobiia bacterium]
MTSDLLIEEERLRAQIERKLADARRREDPVPHLVVNDFFDASFYRTLADAWPPLELFKRDRTGRKYDLVPQLTGADARSAGYEQLDRERRRLWDFFVGTVNRRIVGPLLARIFAPEISARVQQIREAFGRGLITYPMAGARDWTYRPNVGRFMMRANGHDLRPHVDSMPYLLTVLHYFPSGDADEGFGTVFYRAERPLDFEACARHGSTQYFEDAGIRCEEVLRIPFRPNTLLAFPNTLSTAHGAAAPADGMRRVFQYHLSLKGDDEKV